MKRAAERRRNWSDVTRARREERRKGGLNSPKVAKSPRVAEQCDVKFNQQSQNAFEEHQKRSGKENAAFFFCSRNEKKRVCKEKLTDAAAGGTKLGPALTLIPVLMRGKCV
ncbi:hypothetical protein TNCV_3957491 [Trichonephila clavipes]|nr:hypothetical protein TNCV_3957491 [Trichonephila clavipes]